MQSTQSGMQSMPNPGGSGGMPPRKFLKIKPSEIESEGIFNGLLFLLPQDSMLHYISCKFDWIYKKGLPHTSDLQASTIHNFRWLKGINLQIVQLRVLVQVSSFYLTWTSSYGP